MLVLSATMGRCYRTSFLGIWAYILILGANSIWLNQHFRPWGAVVFFGVPSVQIVLGIAAWLYSRRAGVSGYRGSMPEDGGD